MGKILAVDDEIKNLKLIRGFLSGDYEIVCAEDGVQAWEILEQSFEEFELVLLDRMMPNMDGMELAAKMKAHSEMQRIPIIMQTAAALKEQVAEGIAAGVYYYLTKPYSPELLVSIVSAAISSFREQSEILREVNKHTKILALVDRCEFSFATLDEARNLTTYLANFYNDPERVSLGISELLTNAVEHGNLGISYDEKTLLNNEHSWEEEVIARQELSVNRDKRVRVLYERNEREITLIIKDEGDGFEWQDYMEIDLSRITDSHGRGIAMSNLTSFDSLEYRGCGNEVCCRVLI